MDLLVIVHVTKRFKCCIAQNLTVNCDVFKCKIITH